MSDVQNQTFDDLPEQFELPEGRYVAEFRRTEFVTDDEGRDLNNVKLQATAVLEADVEEDLLINSYPVGDRFWLHTPGANRRAKAFFEKIMGMSTEGVSKGDLFEALLGMPVGIEVAHDVSNKTGRTYVVVKNYTKIS